MARLKNTTLFNKNHISIVKIENFNISWDESQDPHICSKYIWGKTDINDPDCISYRQKINLEKNKKSLWVKRKFKSPLGFWYEKEVYTGDKKELTFKKNTDKCTRSITFVYGKYKYVLTYLVNYNGTKLSVETRPWELSDGAFSDNTVQALLKEVTNLFNIAKDNKLKILQKHEWNYSTREFNDIWIDDIGSLKNEVFVDLFGNSKGPRFQSDKEKIESHGFDNITSFRKM